MKKHMLLLSVSFFSLSYMMDRQAPRFLGQDYLGGPVRRPLGRVPRYNGGRLNTHVPQVPMVPEQQNKPINTQSAGAAKPQNASTSKK